MRTLTFLVLGAFIAAPGHAAAQWLYQGEQSAFSTDGVHLAFTALPGGYGLGLRCRDGKTEAIYMTPDTSFDKETYAVANATTPLLKLRVDDDPVVELEGQLVDNDGKAGVLADADPELFVSIGAAKKRVAVVLTLLGENYHEKSFNVRGSTKAIDQLTEACRIGPQ